MRLTFGVNNNNALRGILRLEEVTFGALLAGQILDLVDRDGGKHPCKFVSFRNAAENVGLGDNNYIEDQGQWAVVLAELSATDLTPAQAATQTVLEGSGSPFTHKSQP